MKHFFIREFQKKDWSFASSTEVKKGKRLKKTPPRETVKKLKEEAPGLTEFASPLKKSLERNNLKNTHAQVGLILDISYSMRQLYYDGTIQEAVSKLVPLAVEFDENNELALWFSGNGSQFMDSINTANYEKVTEGYDKIMSKIGSGTNLFPVLSEVLEKYRESQVPTYVLCITDGATSNASQVYDLMIKAANLPIFWQFIGIGNDSYGILEEFNEKKDRQVNNTNFFSLNDISTVDNSELYTKMLKAFPLWIEECKKTRIIKKNKNRFWNFFKKAS